MTYTEPLTPMQVESALRETLDRLEKAPGIVAKAHQDWRDAKRAYETAKGHAFLAAAGTVDERKHQAELATVEERQAADRAEVTYKYATDQQMVLREELQVLRSIGTYAKAGLENTRG